MTRGQSLAVTIVAIAAIVIVFVADAFGARLVAVVFYVLCAAAVALYLILSGLKARKG
jgi:hypothetical protein